MSDMALVKPPDDIAEMRNKLFTLDEPVGLTAAGYALYWPYVDNIWSMKQAKPIRADGVKEIIYRCRLGRKVRPAKKKEGVQQRNRSVHSKQECALYMSEYIYPDGNHTFYRRGRDPKPSHSHTLDESDVRKRPSAIRELVREEAAKGYKAPDIMAALNLCRQALEDAGGKHITRQEIHNQGAEFRKTHPEVVEARKQSTGQGEKKQPTPARKRRRLLPATESPSKRRAPPIDPAVMLDQSEMTHEQAEALMNTPVALMQ